MSPPEQNSESPGENRLMPFDRLIIPPDKRLVKMDDDSDGECVATTTARLMREQKTHGVFCTEQTMYYSFTADAHYSTSQNGSTGVGAGANNRRARDEKRQKSRTSAKLLKVDCHAVTKRQNNVQMQDFDIDFDCEYSSSDSDTVDLKLIPPTQYAGLDGDASLAGICGRICGAARDVCTIM